MPTGDTRILLSYPTITMTKGWLGAATSLYSKGWLNYDLQIVEITGDTGTTGVTAVPGFPSGGSSRFDSTRKKVQQLRKKKIIVRVLYNGKLYEESVVVDEDVKITAKNVKVYKTKNGIDIEIYVDNIKIN